MRSQFLLVVMVTGLLTSQSKFLQGAWLDEQTEKQPSKVAITVVQTESKSENKESGSSEPDEPVAPKLWLGISLKSVEGDLAAFLGSSTGVLIDQVQPESPAAKAGLQKGDIVISVDGKEMTNPNNLLEIMSSASEGVALTLKVQRKADDLEVAVTPEPRTESGFHLQSGVRITRAIEGLEGLDSGRIKLGITTGVGDGEKGIHVLRLGDPSVLVLPDNVELKGNISIQMTKENDGKSVEIKISKESDKPAEVTVKQDEQVQTLTEDQLDQLPEDLRQWIQSALSRKKAKWVDLKSLRGQDGGALRFELKELPELKELSKLLDGKELVEGKVELQKMVEELTKNAKSQAHAALKQALEQAGLSAEQTALQAKEVATQYAEQAIQAARQHAEQAKEYAKVIEEKARVEAEALRQSSQHQSKKDEIGELKAMIEELKLEIAKLRGNK